MRIGYTIASSPLGRVLVGGTSRGISAVCLGESDAPLEAALRKEYPRAEIRREGHAKKAIGRWAGEIVAYLRGERANLPLPADVPATAFQRRVWEELRRIPRGAARSYGEVARAIGRPSASRAVARACATNPVALVIPCHRVVRRDGALGGYRWGVARKRALLERESALRG